MQKLFSDTRCLDKLAEEKFSLTEEILMENAAAGLENSVRDAAENLRPGFDSVSVLVVTGSGGNGADGYALARRLNGSVFFSNVLLRKICFFMQKTERKSFGLRGTDLPGNGACPYSCGLPFWQRVFRIPG